MKIIDKTPYRNDAGEIDIVGRIQGTLKYGLTWYNRIQAQEAVITVLEKQLGSGFTLLRNATLPNTEITLPLVLVGPPGVFLINVTHERGVYLAKDDEWGTITEGRSVESRNFAPARINQVSRTLTFGRVLQVYLDRYGFKGTVAVESILMAADPGMHIESTRPAVRIVMSDALERFAASIAQGRGALNQQTATEILNAIVVGRAVKPALDAGAAPVAEAGSDPGSALPPLGTYASEQPNAQSSPAFSSGLGDFSFDDAPAAAAPNAAGVSADTPVGSASPAAAQAASGQAPRQQAAGKRATAKSKGPLGLTSQQWLILGGLLTLWICIMLGGIVVYYFANR